MLVVFSPPQAASVDAYSFDSRLRPAVVLNPIKRDYYRQRFDVAHELGHLIIHGDAEPGGRLVLAAPEGSDAGRLANRIGDALRGGDVASVILPQYDLDERTFQRVAEAAVPVIQEAGAAALIAAMPSAPPRRASLGM